MSLNSYIFCLGKAYIQKSMKMSIVKIFLCLFIILIIARRTEAPTQEKKRSPAEHFRVSLESKIAIIWVYYEDHNSKERTYKFMSIKPGGPDPQHY